MKCDTVALSELIENFFGCPIAEASLGAYFRFYNHERIHQSLGYGTPADVYRVRGSSGRPRPDEDQIEIAALNGIAG